MAAYFVDSSALVKRYVREAGSGWLSGLLDPAAGNEVYIIRVTAVEVIAAIARRVPGGSVTPVGAAAACAQFRSDLPHDFEVLEATELLLDRAMNLAEAHHLRGYDAVQLAGVVEVNEHTVASGLPPVVLVSSDMELNMAAAAEGLSVDDPNAHP